MIKNILETFLIQFESQNYCKSNIELVYFDFMVIGNISYFMSFCSLYL